MSKPASPPKKSTQVRKERAVVTSLLEAALKGDAQRLQTTVDEYIHKNKNNDDNNDSITPFQVLSQFKDSHKRTALHFACQSSASSSSSSSSDGDDEDIVAIILNNRHWFPNPSDLETLLKQKDKDGLTAIMLAARHQDPAIAQVRVLQLLKRANSLKLGLARSKAGATPLHYAAGAGATSETIHALYAAGQVALNTFSLKGGTPLHWACASSNDFTSTVDALITCGANVNAQNETVPPPLVLAVAAGNDNHAKRLVACKDINLANEHLLKISNAAETSTVVHMASEMNLVGTLTALLAKLLVDKNSSFVQQKDRNGKTPLDLAAEAGHVDCVQLLLSHDSTKPATKDDAKTYIDKAHKQTTDALTATNASNLTEKKVHTKHEVATQNQQGKPPIDKTEANAQRKAKAILASPEPSQDQIEQSLALKKQGNANFSKKNWETALEFYSQAIDINPADAAFYSNRSACFLSCKRPLEALTDAVVAKTLKPDWSKAYYRLAVARLQLDRFEDAAMAAWEGLQLDQENAELKKFLQKCVKRGRQEYQQSKKKATSSSTSNTSTSNGR